MPRHRPNRRPAVALGASTVLVVVLLEGLAWLIAVHQCADEYCFAIAPPLLVRLLASEPPVEPEPESEQARTPTPVAETEPVDDQAPNPRLKSEEHTSPPPVPHDWQALAEDSVQQVMTARYAKEANRQDMWLRTGSVMFADTGEFNVGEPSPRFARHPFRVPLRVLGIGIKIGNCFIGIPIVGVPVEDRTVGPNVIYCVKEYQ